MSVILIEKCYDQVFSNNDFGKLNNLLSGQFIIVDSGCPRSLMGKSDLNRLNDFKIKCYEIETERFRFGPSRLYSSNLKASIKVKIENYEVEFSFYIIDGDVPMLLGNDIMEPLGGNVNLYEKILEFKNISSCIRLFKIPSGHFVIPIGSIAIRKDEDGTNDNVTGHEAEAVMLALLTDTENDYDISLLHQLIGHTAFTSLALTSEEKEEVNKVHKYFGHRSGRCIWDLFAKVNKLSGKRKAVLEEIERCKICSKYKKSPPRPKVGLPVANDFNEVVGLDLKVIDKEKGHYILLTTYFIYYYV